MKVSLWCVVVPNNFHPHAITYYSSFTNTRFTWFPYSKTKQYLNNSESITSFKAFLTYWYFLSLCDIYICISNKNIKIVYMNCMFHRLWNSRILEILLEPWRDITDFWTPISGWFTSSVIVRAYLIVTITLVSYTTRYMPQTISEISKG